MSSDPRTIIRRASVELNDEEAAKVVRNKNITQRIHYQRKKGNKKMKHAATRNDILLTL